MTTMTKVQQGFGDKNVWKWHANPECHKSSGKGGQVKEVKDGSNCKLKAEDILILPRFPP
jgi:hypothetical protein